MLNGLSDREKGNVIIALRIILLKMTRSNKRQLFILKVLQYCLSGERSQPVRVRTVC